MKHHLKTILLIIHLVLLNTLLATNAIPAGMENLNFIDGNQQTQVLGDIDIQTFTINRIDFPEWYRSKRGSIDIHFSEYVKIDDLKKAFSIVPSTNIYWNNTRDIGNNKYRLSGSFEPGRMYFIKMKDPFLSKNGAKYSETVRSFKFPNQPPKLTFSKADSVVELKSRQLVHTMLLNVGELFVENISIPPVAIPLIADVSKSDIITMKADVDNVINGDVIGFKDIMAADPDFKYLLRESKKDAKLFFTNLEDNEEKDFSVPLSFRDDAKKGETVLSTVSNNKKDYTLRHASRLFRITDLSIAYKVSEKSLLVWLTSLNTGKSVDDVKIFAATSYYDFFYLGETGSDGVLLLKADQRYKGINLKRGGGISSSEKIPSLKAFKYLIAVTEDDVSYIATNEGRVDPKGIMKTSRSTQKQKSEKGHVFTERGIYRPGETVHFKGTVRRYDKGEIQLPADKRCRILIKNSKGEVAYNELIDFSEFGTAAGDFALKSYFPLGVYTLFMKPEKAALNNRKDDYARVAFQVQEFRPPRHRVEITYEHESKKTDEYVGLDKKAHFLNATIEGVYYSGGPVQSGKVQWKVYYSSSDYNVKGYEGFSFSHPLITARELVETGESILDKRGQLSIRVPISQEILAGNFGLEVVATVIDIDGRPATGKSLYQHDPEYMVGVSKHKSKVNIDEMQHLAVIVLDKKKRTITKGRLKVEVMNQSQTWVRKYNAKGRTYWARKQIWRKEFSTSVPILKGKADFDFDFSRGGTFLVRFTYASKDGHEYNSGIRYQVQGPGYYGYYNRYDDGRQKDEKNAKGRIIFVQPERPRYKIGDKIKIFVTSNHKLESCLLTIERDGIMEYKVVDGDDIDDIKISAKSEYSPNVYVSIFGTKSRGEFPVYGTELDREAPNFAYGYANVVINKSSNDLEVDIGGDGYELKSGPGEAFTLDLFAHDSKGDPAVTELAVCVVDEGVLALTRFMTPSLEVLTRFTYPLLVDSYELRNVLLLQTPLGFLHNEPLTGGGGRALGKRKDPITVKIRKDFNPVAYYNASIITGEDGKASVTFRLPDTMTSYRIYTVACDKSGGFDSSERLLRVTKDFYIEPGIPRFMTKGDKAKILVSAFNKTNKGGTVKLSIETNGKIEFRDFKGEHEVGEYERGAIPIEAYAAMAGTAELTFDGEFKGQRDVIKLKMPVNLGFTTAEKSYLSNFSRQREITTELKEAFSGLPPEEVGPDEVSAVLTFSDSPFIKLTQGMRYLLRYPYGCIEQRSSGVLGLAGLHNNIKNGNIPFISITETEKFLIPGVDKVLELQTTSGGFGYWPGNLQPHRWGTIYGMTALTLAKEAGIDIPQNAVDKASRYIEKEIKVVKGNDYAFQAYSSFILARHGKLTQNTYNMIVRNLDKMTKDSRLLTLMAGKIGGFEAGQSLRDKLFASLDKPAGSDNYGHFRAPYRKNAVMLIAAKAILENDKLIDDEAANILRGISPRGSWSSTSDTGWCLFALGEYFEDTKSGDEDVNITITQPGVPDKVVTLVSGRSVSAKLDLDALMKDPRVSIKTDSGKNIQSKLALKYPLLDYARSGYSNNFKIEKSIENTNVGRPIRVGDVVKVKLNITISGRGRKDYIVIDDPLPAGLVAINTALKTEEPVPGEDQNNEGYWWRYRTEDGYYKFQPNYFEIRDDRVLVFRDQSWNGKFVYSYYARAICEGEFIMPSTKIQQMYQTENNAYTPRAIVKIEAMPDGEK